jgi:hypothetical protein
MTTGVHPVSNTSPRLEYGRVQMGTDPAICLRSALWSGPCRGARGCKGEQAFLGASEVLCHRRATSSACDMREGR